MDTGGLGLELGAQGRRHMMNEETEDKKNHVLQILKGTEVGCLFELFLTC